MAKANKETTFLVSGAGTGFFYSNRKNKKKNKGEKKLALKKYDPVARKHVLFSDKKLSKLKKKFAEAEQPAGNESGAGEAKASKAPKAAAQA